MSTQRPSDEDVTQRSGYIAWMARNSVAANLLMIMLLVGGLVMLPRIKQEVFPEFDLDFINIEVPYPGASPAEVEQGVLLALEEAVRGVDDVKEVTSTAAEGMGVVAVELMLNANRDRALADIKNNVDRVTSLPEDAEEPVVKLVQLRTEVISVVLSGDQTEKVLRNYGEQLREHLLGHSDLTFVTLAGVRQPEISIEVPSTNLRRYGLTIDDIATRIRAASVDVPGGAVKTRGGEILIRTTERRLDGDGFGNIVLLSQPDGTQVRVKDIATVHDEFTDSDKRAFFFGKPAVMVKAFRVGDQTPVALATAVREQLATFKLPQGIETAVWSDYAEIYEQRVDLLMRNAGMGLVLVLAVLGLFLNLRLAFWVTLGIPISFVGSLLLLPSTDVSINMISLFAYIVVLGIVVDDAIVVGEAVYYRRRQGMAPLAAAIQGTHDVAVPVVFSVMTTMVAFVPMFFVPGVMGKFMLVLPVIVITVLLLSLVESLFILPAHLAHASEPMTRGVMGFINRAQTRFSDGLERFIDKVFAPFLHLCMNYRYFTVAIGVSGMIIVIGLVAGGRVKSAFFPKIDGDIIFAQVELSFGAPIEDTQRAHDQLVAALFDELEARGGVHKYTRGIFHQVGSSDFGGTSDPLQPGLGDGSHLTEVGVYLVAEDERPFGLTELTNAWRERLGEIAGAETIAFRTNMGAPSGKPVDVQLSHPNLEVLEAAGAELAAELHAYEGLYEIDDGFEPGKPQLDFTLTDQGRASGLTATMMARQLRSAFYGAEAVRQQRGRDEVRTYVRLPEAERRSEQTVESLLLRTPTGEDIPVGVAASVKRGRAYTSITREDGRRVVNVTAELDDTVTTGDVVAAGISKDVLGDLMAKYPGLSWKMGGEQQEQAETMAALGTGALLCMIVIFSLLAIVFRSYTQPLVVMSAIPFGLVGAILGHMVLGYYVSMMSFMGITALTGIVVNDSLVLIVATNEFRDEGMSPFEAIIAGATRRFRPILLTSATTCLGLAPMLFETSMQAKFLIPMAVSLAGGVLFATVICLLLVPALYLILEDVSNAMRRASAWLRDDSEPAGVAPAE